MYLILGSCNLIAKKSLISAFDGKSDNIPPLFCCCPVCAWVLSSEEGCPFIEPIALFLNWNSAVIFFLSLLQCLLVVYNDLLLARCRFAWRLLKKKFAIVCIGSAAFCIGRTLATTFVMHRYILSSWSWSFLRRSPISFFKMRCTYVPTRDLPSMIERVWLRWPYGVVYAIAVSVAKNITMNVLTAI